MQPEKNFLVQLGTMYESLAKYYITPGRPQEREGLKRKLRKVSNFSTIFFALKSSYFTNYATYANNFYLPQILHCNCHILA